MEDIKYDFYEFDNKVYCFWNGKYTNGNISGRGTRLYFNNATILEFDHYSFSVIPNDDNDDCCIRNDELQNIVNNMTNINKEWDFIEIKNKDDIDLLFTQLPEDSKYDNTYINEFNKNYEYICGISPIKTLFFIKDRKDFILNELREVIKMCNENNVTWEWI